MRVPRVSILKLEKWVGEISGNMVQSVCQYCKVLEIDTQYTGWLTQGPLWVQVQGTRLSLLAFIGTTMHAQEIKGNRHSLI